MKPNVPDGWDILASEDLDEFTQAFALVSLTKVDGDWPAIRFVVTVDRGGDKNISPVARPRLLKFREEILARGRG